MGHTKHWGGGGGGGGGRIDPNSQLSAIILIDWLKKINIAFTVLNFPKTIKYHHERPIAEMHKSRYYIPTKTRQVKL